MTTRESRGQAPISWSCELELESGRLCSISWSCELELESGWLKV